MSKQTDKFRIALFNQGDLQIELIQHLEGEDLLYAKFLEEKGEGLHHVGSYVKEFDEAVRHMKDLGIPVLAEGDVYGVRYTYFDTEDECGFVTELIMDPNK